MNLASPILGATTVRHLQESAAAPVLEVGSDTLTRADLAHVECYNFHAARLLTNALRDLKVANLRTLYEEIPPWSLALPYVGAVSLAVLGAAWEAKGIGGQAPLENYVKKHRRNGNDEEPVVTFDTIKRRQLLREREERRARRRRVS